MMAARPTRTTKWSSTIMVRIRPSLLGSRMAPLNRHFHQQFGTFTRSAVERQVAPNSLRALSHANQPVVPAPRRIQAFRIEPATVIAHPQRKAVRREFQFHIDTPGVRVL